MSRPWSDTEAEQAAALVLGGHSLESAGKLLGRSETAVRMALRRRLGLTAEAIASRRRELAMARAADLRSLGAPVRVVGDALQLGQRQAERVCAQALGSKVAQAWVEYAGRSDVALGLVETDPDPLSPWEG